MFLSGISPRTDKTGRLTGLQKAWLMDRLVPCRLVAVDDEPWGSEGPV